MKKILSSFIPAIFPYRRFSYLTSGFENFPAYFSNLLNNVCEFWLFFNLIATNATAENVLGYGNKNVLVIVLFRIEIPSAVP